MILPEKHEMLRKLFRQFAETEFTDELLDELEETGDFNWDIQQEGGWKNGDDDVRRNSAGRHRER